MERSRAICSANLHSRINRLKRPGPRADRQYKVREPFPEAEEQKVAPDALCLTDHPASCDGAASMLIRSVFQQPARPIVVLRTDAPPDANGGGDLQARRSTLEALKHVDKGEPLDYTAPCVSGHSSVGRVRASQARCRGFESRCPLHRLLAGLSVNER